MEAKTLQEMKDSGFLELGQVYVERYYTDHYKKILGIKFKYRKRHFRLIKFRNLCNKENEFRYNVLFDSIYNNENPYILDIICRADGNLKLNIVKYNERMFKGFKFKNFK